MHTLFSIRNKEENHLAKQQGHGKKNTTTRTSDKKGNASGNNH
jgi:hypothetical protein